MHLKGQTGASAVFAYSPHGNKSAEYDSARSPSRDSSEYDIACSPRSSFRGLHRIQSKMRIDCVRTTYHERHTQKQIRAHVSSFQHAEAPTNRKDSVRNPQFPICISASRRQISSCMLLLMHMQFGAQTLVATEAHLQPQKTDTRYKRPRRQKKGGFNVEPKTVTVNASFR